MVQRCFFDIFDYDIFRVEEYIVHCTDKIEWRSSFILGLQGFIFILVLVLGTVFIWSRLNGTKS